MNGTNSPTAEVLELTLANFQAQVVEDASPILIDFWAPWCGPCRVMKPVFHEAAQTLKGEVRAATVNVDEQPALAEAFGIRGIPTLILIQGGRVIDAWSGAMPAAALVQRVRARLTS